MGRQLGRRHVRLRVAAAVLIVAAAACGDDQQVHTEMVEGIPEGFPGQMPLPDDAEVRGLSSERDGDRTYLVNVTTGLDLAEVVALYDEQLPARGWDVSHRLERDGGLSLTATGHGYQALVVISAEDGRANVLLTLAPET